MRRSARVEEPVRCAAGLLVLHEEVLQCSVQLVVLLPRLTHWRRPRRPPGRPDEEAAGAGLEHPQRSVRPTVREAEEDPEGAPRTGRSSRWAVTRTSRNRKEQQRGRRRGRKDFGRRGRDRAHAHVRALRGRDHQTAARPAPCPDRWRRDQECGRRRSRPGCGRWRARWPWLQAVHKGAPARWLKSPP